MPGVFQIYFGLLHIALSGFLLLYANEGAHEWQSIGPYSGDIQAVVCSPGLKDLIYVGSRHGLYKSSDGGNNWRYVDAPELENDKVQTIVFSPTQTNAIWIGTEKGGVFQSLDYGNTWQEKNTELSVRNVKILCIHPYNATFLYAGTYGSGVFRSTTGGEVWIRRNSGLTNFYINDLLIHPITNTMLFAATTNGIFYSTDEGQNWQILCPMLEGAHISSLAMNSLYPDSLYIGTMQNGVFRYDLSTNQCNHLNRALAEFYITDIAITQENEFYLLAGTWQNGLFKRSRHSNQWQPANEGMTATQVRSIAVYPHNPRVIFTGTLEGGIFRSEDWGTNWTRKNNGLALASINGIVLPQTQPAWIFAGLENGVFFSQTPGMWQARLSAIPINALTYAASPTPLLLAGTKSEGILKSEDWGGQWKFFNSGVTVPRSNITAIANSSSPDFPYYFGTKEGTVYRYNHLRERWQNIGYAQAPGFGRVNTIVVNPKKSEQIYIGTSTGIYRKYKNQNWIEFNDNLPYQPNALELAIDPQNPSQIYLVLDNSPSLYQSIHEGTDWKTLPAITSTQNPLTAILIDALHPTRLYVGTREGPLYVSFDSGATWEPLGTISAGSHFHPLMLRQRTLYTGTVNAGIYTLRLWPQLVYGPERLIFEETIPGQKQSLELHLENQGFDDLVVSDFSIPPSSPFMHDAPSTITIAPRQTQTIKLKFLPIHKGNYQTVFSFQSNDPVRPLAQIQLAGKGVAPQIDINAINLIDFKRRILFQTHDTTLVIYNSGDANLEISKISVTNDRFSISNVDSFSIEPWQTRQIEIHFQPDSLKIESGNLLIYSNDPVETRNPLTVKLKGQGIPGKTQLSISTHELDLGVVPVRSEKDSAFWITNTSDYKISVLGIQSSDSSIQLPGTTQFDLAQQEQRKVRLRFSPTAVYSAAAEISIHYQNIFKDTLCFIVHGQTAFPAGTFQQEFQGGTHRNAFRMFSVPALLQQSELIKLCESFFGAYNQKKWRLFWWEKGDYLELNRLSTIQITPGRAFWFITKINQTIDYGNGVTVPVHQPYIIDLQPGWNQVGNPFPFTVSWQDIRKATPQQNFLDTLYWYNGQNYMVNQMEPLRGYWVENRNPTDSIQLRIPPKTSETVIRKNSHVGDAADWWLQLAVTCNQAVDDQNFVGVTESALNENDPWDHSEPPPIGDFISLFFPHPEWTRFPGNYTTDFQSNTSPGWYWPFIIRSNIPGHPVYLTLKHLIQLPTNYQVYLFDETAKIARDLTKLPTYQFTSASRGETWRKFRLVVGSLEFIMENEPDIPLRPKNFALHQNFPNPFSGSGTTVQFELPKPATVSLTIFNLMGQEVSRLLTHKNYPSGTYSVYWDGCDPTGKPLPGGIYFYVMTAGKFHTARKVVLTR